MGLFTIRVSGLACFSGARAVELELDDAPGWTVFAGPNGSGKTALLRALALALGAHPPVDAAQWLAPGCDQGAVELPDVPAYWRVVRGSATRQSGRGRARYYRAFRTLPSELPEPAIPLLADGLFPDDWTIDRDLRVRRGGLDLPLSECGDGMTALAALVIDLATADPESIVLVDDIDTHLHPVWQQRIGSWLTAHFPQARFLVATHSPYVCQAADPGALVRLAGPEQPEPPRLLDEETHQRVLYGSGDDTAVSELFGLSSAYSPHAEAERELLVRLERKLYAGQASSSELREYQALGAKLNSSLSARVDEVAARLLGRGR